jgi:hypothetical protein
LPFRNNRIRVWAELVSSNLTEKLTDQKIRNQNLSVTESQRAEASRPWQPLHSINHNIAIGFAVCDRDGRQFACGERKCPERLKMIVRIRCGLLTDLHRFRDL